MSVRAMALEFPEDQTAWYCDRQFMLGDSIMVAPVMSEDGSVQVYFPEGTWTSWWDGKVVSGPRWVTEKHGFGTLPLYVKEGSILLVGSEVGNVGEGFGYDWIEQGGEVRVYGKKVNGSAAVVDAVGKELGTLVVSDSQIKESAGLSDKWKIRKMWEL